MSKANNISMSKILHHIPEKNNFKYFIGEILLRNICLQIKQWLLGQKGMGIQSIRIFQQCGIQNKSVKNIKYGVRKLFIVY